MSLSTFRSWIEVSGRGRYLMRQPLTLCHRLLSLRLSSSQGLCTFRQLPHLRLHFNDIYAILRAGFTSIPDCDGVIKPHFFKRSGWHQFPPASCRARMVPSTRRARPLTMSSRHLRTCCYLRRRTSFSGPEYQAASSLLHLMTLIVVCSFVRLIVRFIFENSVGVPDARQRTICSFGTHLARHVAAPAEKKKKTCRHHLPHGVQ